MTRHHSPVLLAFYLTCLGWSLGVSYPLGLEPAIARPSVDRANSFFMAQSATPEPLPLNIGSRGEAVKELQNRLKTLGFYKGEADSVYGESTKVAVSAFQKSIDLKPDGVVGTTTWSRLQAAAAEKASEENAQSEKDEKQASKSNSSNSRRKKLLLLLIGASGTLAAFGAGLVVLVRILDSGKKTAKSPQADESIALPLKSSKNKRVPQPTPIDTEPPTNGQTVSALTLSNQNLTENPSNPQTSNSAPLVRSSSGHLSKRNVINQLIRELREPDPQKRRKAIWELAQRGDSRAVQPLLDLMIDSDSKQRSLIVEALSQIGLRTLQPMNKALSLSLQDGNPEVRKNAIRDVTLMYESVAQISQILSYAIDDPDPEVQETVRWAMGQLDRIRTPTAVTSLPPSQRPLSFSENQLKDSPPFE
ncbi:MULTISPECIES: peptidoglycan-binding protein [unclassified Coleofasciculus]|uniref:peptidoglycan-binding protein n=1 Tax=unclassified Coleofasciculus TaxID=2692782 RepID=UPI00187FEF97|nr:MULTISPECIES: peptidoglycan-binding protein [unclassified Coleofasciculus]MBE9128134.1 HEAT repeat domain-containing protein [Coleofasciculus sp. LEGE 07081]MBE9147940.1 HEAT repeat domain-containing protein [Coleofasciculus sp. LEGE 07092]